MTDKLRIAFCQANPTVGAISANSDRARVAHKQAANAGADLIVFPELFLSGYPPRGPGVETSFC